MFVFHNRLEEFVAIRIGRRPALSRIMPARCHVKKMINDAGADKGVPIAVKINAPRIARAVGEDFKLFRARMETSNGGVHHHSGFARFGNFHFGTGENPMRQIKPAVRSPSETVQQFVTVLHAEAGQQLGPFVRNVIAVGVFQKQQVRRLPHKHAAVAELNTGCEIETVGKNGDLVGAAVVISVFQNFDAVARLGAGSRAERIFKKFHHPQPPAFVPSHGNGVDDIRLGGKEPNLEPFRHRKSLLRFSGRKRRGAGGSVFSRELFARSRGAVDSN